MTLNGAAGITAMFLGSMSGANSNSLSTSRWISLSVRMQSLHLKEQDMIVLEPSPFVRR